MPTSDAVVAGIDLAAIFPRWFTLRRGGYLTLLFAFVMQPWQLLNGATNFLTIVGSFNIFLGPFMGIMFVDYFVLRRRLIKLTAVYDESPSALYWYRHGFNWRAVVAWPLGWWFLIPGLAQRAMAEGALPMAWTRLYSLSWFVGSFTSGLIYWLFDRFVPMPDKHAVDDQDYFGHENGFVEGVDLEQLGKESLHGSEADVGKVATVTDKAV